MQKQAKPYALGLAPEGQAVRIESLAAGKNLDNRLSDLGLNIGAEVTVVQRQGSGLVVAREAARIAIGGGMAMKIMVRDADV